MKTNNILESMNLKGEIENKNSNGGEMNGLLA